MPHRGSRALPQNLAKTRWSRQKNEALGVLQEKWEDLKKGLGTLKDATGWGVSPEVAAGARQRVLDGAKGIAEDAAFKVGGGGSSDERAGKAQAQAAAQMDKLREAYSRNGLPGVLGALATKMVMDKVADKVMGAVLLLEIPVPA